MGQGAITNEHFEFDEWMSYVDGVLDHHTGLTSREMPDSDWRDAYDGGEDANAWALHYLKAVGFIHDAGFDTGPDDVIVGLDRLES